MPRMKKENRPTTVRLDKEIYDSLNKFYQDSGQPKTVAVERALSMYIDDYYEKKRIIEGKQYQHIL